MLVMITTTMIIMMNTTKMMMSAVTHLRQHVGYKRVVLVVWVTTLMLLII